MSNHCQHVADFYQYRPGHIITWDNYMRDALGVKRLSVERLQKLYEGL